MGLLFSALYYLLFALFLLMWVRFLIDMVQVINREWRPRGILLVLIEFAYTVTDPGLRIARRVIPPLRVGAVAFDLAWTVVLLVIIVLMSVTSGLARAL